MENHKSSKKKPLKDSLQFSRPGHLLSINQAVIITDLDGTINFWNKAATELYGWTAEEAIGRDIIDLIASKQTKEQGLEIMNLLSNGQSWSGEFSVQRKNGNYFPVFVTNFPFYNKDNELAGVIGISADMTAKKNSELALMANEARWQALIENIQDIFLITTPQGVIEYLSPSITRVLGYELEDLPNQNLYGLFHSEDKNLIHEKLVSCLENPGKKLLIEKSRLKHKDGSWIWVEGSFTNLLEDSTIHNIVYTARDISKLVESSATLQLEQENREALINATDDLMWSINKNYELVAANASFVKTLKLTTGIYIAPGDSLLRKDKFTKKWLTFWQSLYSRAFAGESFQKEIYTAKTASIKEDSWAEVSFNPIIRNNKVEGIACSSRNITSRKRQEEKDRELAVAQSLFSSIVNNSQDAIISKDLDGTITSWNKGAEGIFGYTADEIIGKSILAIIPPELKEEESFILNQIRDKQLVQHYETIRLDKYGNRKNISLSVSPILDNTGKMVGVSKISRDITKQKRDAIALQQNESRLQAIINSQTNYIIRTDLEGRYTYYNDKFFEDYGWTNNMKNLLGVSGMNSIMPYHHEVVKSTVNRCCSEPNSVFQVVLDKPASNGSIISTFWDFICLTDINGQPVEIQCVGVDITKKLRTEKQLKQSLEEKENILESIGDAFFAVNRDWIVTYWNKEAELLTGRKREQLVGKNIWEEDVDAVDSDFYRAYHEAMETGKVISIEGYYPALKRWFEATAYPSDGSLSVYFKDVTLRKEADIRLKQANERFEKVTEATHDVIWDWDIVNQTFYRSNAIERFFGKGASKSLTETDFWKDKFHPEDAIKLQDSIDEAISNPQCDRWELEYRIFDEEGKTIYVTDRGVILRNNEGQAIRMVGAMTDISEQKQMALQLSELNKSLQQYTQELERSNDELEQFAFVTSHDLQEPLRMISSFMDLLKRKYGDQLDEKGHQYIHFARDGAKRMKQIILDLLEYSKANKPTAGKEQVNLNTVFSDFMLLRRKLISEKSGSLKANNLPIIYTYKAAITQIFHCLLDNALKYAKNDIAPQIEVYASESETEWEFSIQDNGIGIDPQFYDKIFMVFQRLHDNDQYSGTGIGLSITKRHVEFLGGRIWLESKPGEGTVFYFTIRKTT